MIHWFDITVIVLILGSTVYSLFRGLIKELFSLGSFVIAFLLAHRYYSVVSSLISDFISNGVVADLLSYGFLFIFTAVVVSQIGKFVRRLVYHADTLSFTDRVGGALMGFIKATVIIAVLMIPVGLLPYAKKEILMKSTFAPFILNISHELSKASFSDKNIMENVQDRFVDSMKDKIIEGMKGKIKLPDITGKLPESLSGLFSKSSDKKTSGSTKSKTTGSKKSSKKADKSESKDKVSDNISERDKEKLKKLIDNLIDEKL